MRVIAKRQVGVSALLGVVVLVVVWGFLPSPVLVDMAAVTRGPLRVTVDEQGRTQVKDRYIISAPVSGFMRRISLKAGDPVSYGQLVACLEPVRSQALDPRSRASAQAAQSSAGAALSAVEEKERAARADAEYAAQKMARLKGLLERHSVSQDSYEQAQSEARRAEAVFLSARSEVKAARSELAKARTALGEYAQSSGSDSLGSTNVFSPIEGRVLRVYRESEGTVAVGEPIMDVGCQQNLEVRVEVLSADAVKIRKGTPVVFERWGGDAPLTGRVRVVEPGGFTKISSLGVEEQRVVVLVDFTTPPSVWQNLGDSYRLDSSFIIWESGKVLQIPASAVFRQGAGRSVFAVHRGRARLRTVRVGHSNGLATEVLSGLQEGEYVVTHPDDTIQDGTRIKSRD
jgi:HlyD family secretion protein